MMMTSRRTVLCGTAALLVATALPATAAVPLREIGPFDTSAFNARGMHWTGYGTEALQQLYDGMPAMNPMNIDRLYVKADDYDDWRQQLMLMGMEHEQLDVLDWLEREGSLHLVSDQPEHQGWFLPLRA